MTIGESGRGDTKKFDFLAHTQEVEGLIRSDSGEYEQKKKEYTKNRLNELESGTSPRQISSFSKDCGDFIHPKSEIKRVKYLDGFCVDDEGAYEELIDNIKFLKTQPGYTEASVRAVCLPALQWTIEKYFGNRLSDEDTNNRNKFFYTDHSSVDSEPVSMKKDLKGKKMAMCAEKAALAQNLLSFMGMQSELVISSKCNLSNQESENSEDHAYNLVTTDKGNFIYDPTNPRIFTNEKEELVYTQAALYPISVENYQRLKSGGTVEIEHKDMKVGADGSQNLSDKAQKRIYGYSGQ